MTSLRDGLGHNQVIDFSGAGLEAQHPYVTGSLTVANQALFGNSAYFNTGSPYNVGWITVPFTARTIISGGMWVTASGGLALAGPASAKQPLGVAAATAQSGATVNVIVRGIVPMIAEGTIAAAGGVMVGAGGGLNTVQPHVAGSGAQYATLDSAASGTTVAVFVVL